jgi:hypothetical protein
MGLEYGPKNGDTNFNIKKVCVKTVQKNMSEVQNYARKQVCSQRSKKMKTAKLSATLWSPAMKCGFFSTTWKHGTHLYNGKLLHLHNERKHKC